MRNYNKIDMLKILNLVTDQIFINDLIDVCEYTKNNHTHDYVVVSDDSKSEFRFIKNPKVHTIKKHDLLHYIAVKSFNVVIMHGLFQSYIDWIPLLPKSIKLVWFAWGFDLYTYPHFMKPFIKVNLYHKETLKMVMGGLRNRLAIYHALLNSLLRKSKISNAIYRVDYFSGVLREEYEMMKRLPFFRAKRLSFNYFSLSSPYKGNVEDYNITGNNIMVGNSGDSTNNHIDIFNILYERGITDRKIYVPLSYGGTPDYISKVVNCGKNLFKNNFVALRDFLPFPQYREMLSSCSNVIMFHERQQAMGNISMSLWDGKKLFLSKSSIAFQAEKRRGHIIFSIQDDLGIESVSSFLPKEEMLHNRKVLLSYGSLQIKIEQMRRVYADLEK